MKLAWVRTKNGRVMFRDGHCEHPRSSQFQPPSDAECDWYADDPTDAELIAHAREHEE